MKRHGRQWLVGWRDLFAAVVLLLIVAGESGAQIRAQQSTTGPMPPAAVLVHDALKPTIQPSDVRTESTLSIPAYLWRHGCGPTAVGMIIGYYDGLGYSDLIPGSASIQTTAVNQAIASGGTFSSPNPPGSERHYEDYALPEDSWPTLITDNCITAGRTPHTDDSLADFMDTSKSTRSNYYGWSWSSDVGQAFQDYVNLQNSSYAPSYQQLNTSTGALTWGVLTSEIDAGRPMVFLVDTDGDGSTDHFVPVVGYRTTPSQQYACWDTWTTASIRWENFSDMANGVPWGIWGGWRFQFGAAPLSPDLIIQSIVHSPATPVPGQAVEFTVTVKNQGTANAGLFAVGFWSDRASAPEIGTLPEQQQDIMSLAAGASTTLTFNITAGAEGAYTAWAYADRWAGTSEVAEFNEGNNASGPHAWTVGSGNAQWTFMVYLDADNNLEAAGIDDFLEMAAVGSDANVKIVVLFDRISGYDTSYDDWTDTRRGIVMPGDTPTTAWGQSVGEKNMGAPATLVEFVQWAMGAYPADHYGLILWNHGAGWRSPQVDGESLLGISGKESPIFKAVCWDDSSGGDCLYMNEVQTALATIESTAHQPDLVGFDACLMAMTEVAYEIRDHGLVMVTSQDVEPGDGWPYDTILGDLNATPSMTAAELGTVIVDRYYQSYGSSQTQSAVDLAQMQVLADQVSTFATTLMDHWSDADRTAVRSAAAAVQAQLNATVIHEHHGASWPGAHGLAIYFPSSVGSFSSDYNDTVIDFPANTQWDEFLSQFYASMSGSWIAEVRAQTQEFYYPENADLYDFCQKLIDYQEGMQPDLIVETISHAPAYPVPGATVTFTVAVRNQGLGDAGLFAVGFWSNLASAPEIGTPPEQQQDIQSLAAGDSTNLMFNVAAPAEGTCTAWAYADQWAGTSEVAESNEDNNASGPHAWTVVAPPPAPYNPYPVDGATGVPTDVVMSWNNGSDQYSEDFNDGQAQDWDEITDAQWEVVAGEYRASDVLSSVVMQSTHRGQTWQDCSVQATFRRTGDLGSAAWIVVRATEDFNKPANLGSAYFIGISGNGAYYVGKDLSGVFSFIQPWTPSPALNTGEATNGVKVSVLGAEIKVFLNGQLAWSGTDADIPDPGRIGLLGYTGNTPVTVHYYDDVAVGEPVLSAARISPAQRALHATPIQGGTQDTAPKAGAWSAVRKVLAGAEANLGAERTVSVYMGTSAAPLSPGGTVLDFPSADSTVVAGTGFLDATRIGSFWSAARGDSVTESFTSGLDTIKRVVFDFVVPSSVLDAGVSVDWNVLVNGQEIGQFVVASGQTGPVHLDFSFAPIAGPQYEVRFEVTNEVPVGAGSHTLGYAGIHAGTIEFFDEGCETVFDVYMGADPAALTLAAQNLTAPSYDPPGDLLPGTAYYWKVVARNSCGETEGPVWSFTTVANGGISGRKWEDLNSNSTWDEGEPALQGWEIYLDLNQNGEWNASEPINTTNASGEYQFIDLDAGTYIVAEVLQEGWNQTYPTTGQRATYESPRRSNPPIDELKRIVIDSPPRPPVGVVRQTVTQLSQSAVMLSGVPTSTWTYGCSATSAGMIFGYYDRTSYPNMYTGPTNGGVCPLTDLGQGIGTPIPGSCYIIATQNGFDGRSARGHVDDYWISYGSAGPDPWEGNWTEHTWADCTADFMGTNQWKWDWNQNGTLDANSDGGTSLFTSGTSAKLYDYVPAAGCGLPQTALCHGLRLFAESRAYNVIENYTQRIDVVVPGGFSFADYKAQIDAGRPVMIQVVGHTMVGVGYNDPDTVYLHDTWDNLVHNMTWGDSYAGMDHVAMTVIHLDAAGIPGTHTVILAPGDIVTDKDFGNRQITHTITATAGPNGLISPSGAVSVPHGDNRNFMITPDAGYEVDNVLVDGGSVGSVTSYTFNNVTTDHTIHATFKLVPVECVIDNTDDASEKYFQVITGPWNANNGGTSRWPIDDQASANYRWVTTASGGETRRAEWVCTEHPAGWYAVSAWWPVFTYAMGRNVAYEIHHADGIDTVRVDQNTNGGQWNALGAYRFDANSLVVQIHNGQSTPGTYVVADAVKFVKATDNMVGYWQFEEESGTEATDSSGNGNHGTVADASWSTEVAPIDGGAGSLEFNGSSSEVNVGDSASLSTFSSTKGVTAQAWMKLRSIAPTFNRPIVSKWGGGADADDEWSLQIDASGHLYFVVSSSTTPDSEDTVLVSAAPLAVDRWYHVAATWDGNAQLAKLYVDGKVVDMTDAAVTTIADTTMELRVGAGGAGFEHFDGWLDEVKVYNSARSEADIAADAGERYVLTMAVAGGDGTTTPAIGEHVYYGVEEAAITAVGIAPFFFSYWDGDVADPNSASTTVTMNADKTITAFFIHDDPGPECIIDNKDAGFSVVLGAWGTNNGGTSRWPIDDQANANYRWVATTSGEATARARYTATSLGAGTYTVSAWWPDFTYSMGQNVAFEIHDTGGPTTIRQNENINGGQWVTLGTYTFAGAPVVEIHNGQSAPGSYVVADAVKFVQTAPPETGTLQVALAPQAAIDTGAQWQVDGGAWQPSGTTLTVSVGSHTVSYKTVAGWTKPADEAVEILQDQLTATTGTYVQVPTGTLQVALAPQSAIDAGAQWQVDGGAWQPSGATLTVGVGSHTVSYKAIAGWTQPADEVVSVAADTLTTTGGTYVASTGCIVDNKDAGFSVVLGAWGTNNGGTSRWPIDDQANANYRWAAATSGEATARARYTATSLGAGTYTVSAWWPDFTYSMAQNVAFEVHDIAGPTTIRQNENINGGQWVALGTYTFAGAPVVEIHNGQSAPGSYVVADAVKFIQTAPPETGTLQATIAPQSAIDAGAQWQVDGGAWQPSGTTLTVGVGSHTVSYKAIAGWTQPADEVVSVAADTLTTTGGTYVESTECIVDNKDAGFSVVLGAWGTNNGGTSRWPIDDQANANYRWVATTSGEATARAEWSCTTLPAGTYRVYAWWADFTYSMGQNVAYEVHHTGGPTTVRQNQNINGGQWVLLGEYDFAGGGHVVQIHNGTSTPGTYVVADAVKFVKVE